MSRPPFFNLLRDLLTHQEDAAQQRAAAHPRAPAQTSAAPTDALAAPALVLVQRALGRPLSAAGPVPPMPGVRPIYRPLICYAVARATGVHPDLAAALAATEPADTGDHPDVSGRPDTSGSPAVRGPAPSTSPPTTSRAVVAMWSLSLLAVGRPTPHLADLVTRQLPTGELQPASPGVPLDLHWYDELVLLHILASAHALQPSPTLQAAVARSARFHTLENQPDHATTQPWALHALAASPDTLPLADLLLHGALTQNAGRLDAISRILIADALLASESPLASEISPAAP